MGRLRGCATLMGVLKSPLKLGVGEVGRWGGGEVGGCATLMGAFELL